MKVSVGVFGYSRTLNKMLTGHFSSQEQAALVAVVTRMDSESSAQPNTLVIKRKQC